MAMRDQPTRRFRHVDHDDKDSDGEDALECDGETPGEVIRAVGAAVVDPVGDKRSDGYTSTLEADELATALSFAASSMKLEIVTWIEMHG